MRKGPCGLGVWALVAGVTALASPHAAGSAGSEVSVRFDFTGAPETFEVPPGVLQLDVEACGAQGADGEGGTVNGVGGLGGVASATINVVDGEVLTVVVGQAGVGDNGGYNGGGDGFSGFGGGGGGASDVRRGGTELADRIVVGSGGGGGGLALQASNDIDGGVGGGLTGGNGGSGSGLGGSGGTQAAGGARGSGDFGSGGDGELGQGGFGLTAGGGGGLYGGGGGGVTSSSTTTAGGGGGGSGLGDEFVPGSCAGDGWVTISYTQCPTDDEFEENDSQVTAESVTSGTLVSAVVCDSDDDWYSIPVVTGQVIKATSIFDHATGNLDLELFDPSGATVASSASLSDDEEIIHNASASGEYAVRVSGGLGVENGYELVLIAPLVTLSPGNAIIFEGDAGTTAVSLPVSLSEPAPTEVTVDWRTTQSSVGPGLADEGVDFESASGSLTFAPGETTKNVPLVVNGDLIDEPPFYYGEWGFVSFSNLSTNARFEPGSIWASTGILIIADDDPTPTLTPGAGVVFEGDTGTVTVDVPVTLSNPSATPITVDWETADLVGSGSGAALSGVDYAADSGSLTFAPGETSKTIPITVIGDTDDEPPAYLGEWGFIRFSNLSPNAAFDPANFFAQTGIFIVVDDD